MNKYNLKRVRFYNLFDIKSISDILYACGKDMAEKYNIHHWDNGYLKTFLIAIYSSLKGCTYILSNDNNAAIATFQVSLSNDRLHFGKLATHPQYAGKGIGTYCINRIEKIASAKNCKEVYMEVYDKSQHAIDFYKHKGYEVCGETKTIKYTEIKMRKIINR